MAVHKFQVTFPTDTAIPADYVTNTWHFTPFAPPGITDYDNVRDMLKDFYNTVAPGNSSTVASMMSAGLNTPAIVKAYNVEDTPPRAPVYESTFAVTFGTGDSLPSEVALCLSFQATRVSGQPQAQRRNRVYLGPFKASVNDVNGRPAVATYQTIGRAADALLDASTASATWDWQVYSPTRGVGYAVNNGWVDNSWDSQRRRGVAATTRFTFS